MRIFLSALLVFGFGLTTSPSHAQSPRPVPYSAQLRTDPSVGNVQGIQRYGRPLRTDPDQGEGFSYHVYPVAENPGVIAQVGATAPVAPRRSAPSGGIDADLLREIEDASEGLKDAIKNNKTTKIKTYAEALVEAREKLNKLSPTVEQSYQAPQSMGGPVVVTQSTPAASPYPTPFDWTQGIRNLPPGGGAGAYVPRPPGAGGYQPTQSFVPDQSMPAEAQALVFSRSKGESSVYELFQQPLIQIKMRVVEVERSDQLAANSILEYVSSSDGAASLTSGEPLNGGNQNLRGLSNFALGGLISDVGTGAGSLINLTSEHINWVASILATRFDADVITAPEMVTTNGQNVEFVAGSKLPFQLGQNVINGSSNNIQQVFYKHVGTMVSVTPTIINWGFHGEGRGEGAISAQEIPDWNELLRWMMEKGLVGDKLQFGSGPEYVLSQYTEFQLMPFGLKSELLGKLNDYGRSDLLNNGLCLVHPSGPEGCNNWKPDDCTIDLTVVVRLSDGGKVSSLEIGDEPTVGEFNTEKNIRAVANVIQVKSGHGVVMAGLIGEREVTDEAKIPVIGDLPIVGALFRAKQTNRNKTEVLIFIEAKVLDRDPGIARLESSNDFLLGKGYVDGEFLENPLECGMYQVGFGSYLPPLQRSECDYWERHGRKLRNVGTHVSDVLK